MRPLAHAVTAALATFACNTAKPDVPGPPLIAIPAGSTRGLVDPCTFEPIDTFVPAFEIHGTYVEIYDDEWFREHGIDRLTRVPDIDLGKVNDGDSAELICRLLGLELPTLAELRRAAALDRPDWEWGAVWWTAPVCPRLDRQFGLDDCRWTTASGVEFRLTSNSINGTWVRTDSCGVVAADVIGHFVVDFGEVRHTKEWPDSLRRNRPGRIYCVRRGATAAIGEAQ